MKTWISIIAIVLYSFLIGETTVAPQSSINEGSVAQQVYFSTPVKSLQSMVVSTSLSTGIVTVNFTPAPLLKWKESLMNKMRMGAAPIVQYLKYDRYSIRDYQIKKCNSQRLFPFHHFW